MLLATLYGNYNASDFDLENASEAPKRLVIVPEEAIQWAEAEMAEGRGEPLEWVRDHDETYEGNRRWISWTTDCNEQNEPEEWILVLEDVQFWKP